MSVSKVVGKASGCGKMVPGKHDRNVHTIHSVAEEMVSRRWLSSLEF